MQLVMSNEWSWSKVQQMGDAASETVPFKLAGLETVAEIWQESEVGGDGRCPIALMNARWGDRWRKQQDRNTALALPEGDEPVTQFVRAGGIKQRWSRWRAILRCVIALAESKGVKNSTTTG